MSHRLVILGGGESGVGAAILGKKEGYEVFVSDGGSIKPTYKQALFDNITLDLKHPSQFVYLFLLQS